MGMNSAYLSVAVFGKTQKDAERFLSKLVYDMKFGDVKSVRHFPNMEVILKDGSRYKTLPANDGSRGYRYEKAYVQRGIDQEFIYTRIWSSFSGEENIEYYD